MGETVTDIGKQNRGWTFSITQWRNCTKWPSWVGEVVRGLGIRDRVETSQVPSSMPLLSDDVQIDKS